MIGLIVLATVAWSPVASATRLDPEAAPLAGPAVIILWASWCASCKAELERLPSLTAAAAPLPIRTLAIDPPDQARALVEDRGLALSSAYADSRTPRTVLDEWGGPGAVLPVAVAIDRDGKVCGRKRGLLGTDQLKQWATMCRR